MPSSKYTAPVILSAALGLAGVTWMAAPSPRPAWLPDPKLTPGVVVALPQAAICDRGYAGRARDVTEADRKVVFRRYGIPWERHGDYEVDHFICLGLGGQNAIENLWPQPWTGPYNAHDKDRLEVRLRSLVCKGQMGLHAAQEAMRIDWAAEYRRQGLDKPRFGAGPDAAEPDPEGFGDDE